MTRSIASPIIRTLSACLLLFLLALPASAAGVPLPEAAAVESGEPSPEEAARMAAATGMSVPQWRAFSRNVNLAIHSGHDGLRHGAMRLIIHYRGQLDVRRPAVIEVVRVYRDHQDVRMRHMAVVALGALGDPWAIDHLRRAHDFEREAKVQRTIRGVVAAWDAERASARMPRRAIGS